MEKRHNKRVKKVGEIRVEERPKGREGESERKGESHVEEKGNEGVRPKERQGYILGREAGVYI